jgi:hypothetical protein
MRMEPDIFNYIIMITIIGLIAATWAMLSSISLDNKRMLHNVTDILNKKTGNITNQQLTIHELSEILGNVTSSNGVLNPRHR